MKDYDTLEEVYEGIFQRVAKSYDLDYYWFWTPEDWTWKGNSARDLKAAVVDMRVAISAAKAVQAPFQLATSGWVLGPEGDRSLLGQALPSSVALSCINQEMGRAPIDAAFSKIDGHSKWAIPWIEDDAALTTPQLWVARMRRDARRCPQMTTNATGCWESTGAPACSAPTSPRWRRYGWTQDQWRPASTALSVDKPVPPGN